MKLTAFLADHVAEATGKLFVNGAGWNIWWAPEVPFVVPHMGIAAIVTVPYTATNQVHRFTIRLVDEDGREVPLGDAPPGVETDDGKIRRIDGEFNVGRPPQMPPGDEQNLPLAVNFGNVVLERFGVFAFEFELDGSPVERLTFRLAPPMGAQMRTS